HVFGAHVFQRAQLLDRIDIFRFQHDSPARSLAAGLHARLPAAHNHGAFGKRVAESVHDGALKPGAVRHQQHHGDDAPRDAQHRERRAEAMRDERSQSLRDDFAVEPHVYASYRSDSTGGSAAARAAGYSAARMPTTASAITAITDVPGVTIMPEKRAGMGSMLMSLQSATPPTKPIMPLMNVNPTPSMTNCLWM